MRTDTCAACGLKQSESAQVQMMYLGLFDKEKTREPDEDELVITLCEMCHAYATHKTILAARAYHYARVHRAIKEILALWHRGKPPSYIEIAQLLNELGYREFMGRTWTEKMVRTFLDEHKIKIRTHLLNIEYRHAILERIMVILNNALLRGVLIDTRDATRRDPQNHPTPREIVGDDEPRDD